MVVNVNESQSALNGIVCHVCCIQAALSSLCAGCGFVLLLVVMCFAAVYTHIGGQEQCTRHL